METSPQNHTTMVDMPDKIVGKILSYIPAKEVQTKRVICTQWNRVIETEFGILIIVNNENYQTMLACGSATKAKFCHFTAPFTEEISFSRSLTDAEFVGEIGRRNIIELFKNCSNIDHLQFTNIFFVDVYSRIACDGISFPLTHLKFIVSFFQDRLCMAELIVIDLLTKIQGTSLSTISIHSEDPMSTVRFRFLPQPDEDFPDDDLQLVIRDIQEPEPHNNQIPEPELRNNQRQEHEQTIFDILALPPPPNFNEQRTETEDGGENATPEENPPPELVHEPGVHNFIFIGMNMWEEGPAIPLTVQQQRQQGNNSPPSQPFPVPSDIFTELMLQNHVSLKNLATNFAEFTCLGDISHWDESRLSEIQLENVCYSFSGTRDDNGEYLLIRNQHSLKSLEMFMLHDDIDSEHFWQDVTRAITSSYETLQNAELTIFTEEDWTVDLGLFSTCRQLKKLIFNHYSRKSGIENLPISLEMLKLNGTLTRNQFHSIAHRLVNLKIFELHLNMDGDPLDMEFFTNILKCPHLQKISLFACPIGPEEHEFLHNTPGIVTREEYAFSMENCLVLIHVDPNFERTLLTTVT